MTTTNGLTSSPELGMRPSVKHESQGHNVYRLSAKEKAIHENTVRRHLSNRSIVTSQKTDPTSGTKSKSVSPEDRMEHAALTSFPAGARSSKTLLLRRNPKKSFESVPVLSPTQREKVESGLYLHPSQIPRSLSFDFIGYQPDSVLSVLYDLPMYGCIGIGGDDAKSKLIIVREQMEEHIQTLPIEHGIDDDDGDDVELDIHLNTKRETRAGAPDSIALESSISRHSRSHYKLENVHSKSKRAAAMEMKQEIDSVLHQGYTRNLLIAAFQAMLGSFICGWGVGVLNVPQRVIQDATGMTDDEFAMLDTLYSIGGLVGALAAGPIQDKIGRKNAILVMDTVYIVSALMTYFYANNDLMAMNDPSGYLWFWTARFVVGVASGLACGHVPTYLGEISPPLIRGAIGTGFQCSMNCGIAMSNLVGYESWMGGETTWPLLFLPQALSVFHFFTIFTFPESPKWLFQQGREEEAKKALQRLRMTEDVRADMHLMEGGIIKRNTATAEWATEAGSIMSRTGSAGNKDQPLLTAEGSVNHDQSTTATTDRRRDTIEEVMEETTCGIPATEFKAFKWAMIIAVVVMCMQQFSGINAVMFYSSTILEDAGITSAKGKWLGTTGISMVNFLGVFTATFLVDRAGRRILLMLSGTVLMLALIGASVAIMMNDTNSDPIWGFVSIGCLTLFVFAYEAGLGPLVWLMMVEVSPMKYRGIIVSISTMMCWTACVVVAQFSGPMLHSEIKLFGYAAFTFLGILFTIRYIPETKGKTAAQIQSALNQI